MIRSLQRIVYYVNIRRFLEVMNENRVIYAKIQVDKEYGN
jgi:hypothetical protein